ncbi:hypothetical protein SIID45300_02452 [Candidatus Magnetaquicoccaceae bacterium FCR-1]|uniref:Uncharacterized protein n=1 Tax=Candidatus Magnetaquiglobus chichijimensis TaxID=3141448 RepID=A0ABQ0CB57_9PROT
MVSLEFRKEIGMVSLEFPEFPDSLGLEKQRAGFPMDWEEQGRRFGIWY